MSHIFGVLVVCLIVENFVLGALRSKNRQYNSIQQGKNWLQPKIKELSKYCQDYDEARFRVTDPYDPINPAHLHGKRIDWDLITAFDESDVVLGRGGFGVVKEVCFPFFQLDRKAMGDLPLDLNVGRIAVKSVKTSELESLELKLMHKMSQFSDAPRYFGCMFSEDQETTYILQTRLENSLLDIITQFQDSRNLLSRWWVHKEIFVKTALFNQQGYVHNDLKPQNIMLFNEGRNLAIIDYGLAQLKGDPLDCAGTPFYMRWTKCESKSKRKATFGEDLYSAALTTAVMENEGDMSVFWIPLDKYAKKPDYDKCEDKAKSSKCRLQIYTATMTILQENYPELFKSRKWNPAGPKKMPIDKMDFIDLIEASLTDEQFEPEPDDVIRIANDFFKKKIITTYETTSQRSFNVAPAPKKVASCSTVNKLYDIKMEYDQVLIDARKKLRRNNGGNDGYRRPGGSAKNQGKGYKRLNQAI